MKHKMLALSALMSAALVTTSPANANSYSFDFLSTDTSNHAFGTIGTASVLNAVGGYDITSIGGSVTGTGAGSIIGLEPNPNQPYAYVTYAYGGGYQIDNDLFLSTPHLNSNGVIFGTTGGNYWNLWGNSTTDYELHSYTAGVDTHGALSITAVPEPETYAMMLAGLGLMGFIARRRKQNLAAA